MESNLQIISGKYRGRKLALPPLARPTQNRARIAIFNMLLPITNHESPITVWDAFAGSGAFGIEFLSRRDDVNVIFTDVSPDSIRTINKNLINVTSAQCPSPSAIIEQTDARAAIDKYGAMADLIFIDPPYDEPTLGPAFAKRLTPVARPGTILVWEMESKALGDGYWALVKENWEVLRDKTYGRARFLILQKVQV